MLAAPAKAGCRTPQRSEGFSLTVRRTKGAYLSDDTRSRVREAVRLYARHRLRFDDGFLGSFFLSRDFCDGHGVCCCVLCACKPLARRPKAVGGSRIPFGMWGRSPVRAWLLGGPIVYDKAPLEVSQPALAGRGDARTLLPL